MGYEGRVAGWTDVVGCMEGCVRRLWAGSDWDDVSISAQALRILSRMSSSSPMPPHSASAFVSMKILTLTFVSMNILTQTFVSMKKLRLKPGAPRLAGLSEGSWINTDAPDTTTLPLPPASTAAFLSWPDFVFSAALCKRDTSSPASRAASLVNSPGVMFFRVSLEESYPDVSLPVSGMSWPWQVSI